MARNWRRTQRGSALMLAPAGILVLILLAAISCDSALAFMGQRELQNEVAAAANDGATEAIPNTVNGGLQDGSAARPDPLIVQRVAENTVMHAYSGGLTATDVQTVVQGATVTVTATGRVHYIFAAAIPGAPPLRQREGPIGGHTAVRKLVTGGSQTSYLR